MKPALALFLMAFTTFAAEPDWKAVEDHALEFLQRYVRLATVNPPGPTRTKQPRSSKPSWSASPGRVPPWDSHLTMLCGPTFEVGASPEPGTAPW